MSEIRNPSSDILTAGNKIPQSRGFSKFFAALVSFEVVFLLFMWAGRYKTIPFFLSTPIDLTLLFFLLSASVGFKVFFFEVNIFRSLYDIGSSVFLLFMIWIFISFLWSSKTDINSSKMIYIVVLLSWSFYGPYLLISTSSERTIRFMKIIMLFSVSMLLYWAYIRFVLNIRYIGADESSLIGPNYLGYGEHAMCLAFGFFSLALVSTRGVSRSIYFILTLFMIITLLFIGGKGPLGVSIVVLLIGSVIILFKQSVNRSIVRYFQFFLIIVIILSLIMFAFNYADQETIKKIELELRTVERLLIMFGGQSGFDGSTTSRVDAQQVALSFWFKAPFIGWGVGEFCVIDPVFCYPHNLIIEVLMELGLVGFWILVGILSLGLIRVGQVWRPNCSNWAVLMISMVFISGIISRATYQGYLPDERLMFAMLGLILGLGRERKSAVLAAR